MFCQPPGFGFGIMASRMRDIGRISISSQASPFTLTKRRSVTAENVNHWPVIICKTVNAYQKYPSPLVTLPWGARALSLRPVAAIRFTTFGGGVAFGRNNMQLRTIGALAAAALVLTGCAGPERKFSRGINNVTEFARMGEIRRSMEQTALWDGTDQAYTLGFMRGLNRTLLRTGVGVWEVLSFPISDSKDGQYEPIFLPEQPVYPDASRPSFVSDPSWGPDTNLGFSGGSVAPHVPGSKFQIFDY